LKTAHELFGARRFSGENVHPKGWNGLAPQVSRPLSAPYSGTNRRFAAGAGSWKSRRRRRCLPAALFRMPRTMAPRSRQKRSRLLAAVQPWSLTRAGRPLPLRLQSVVAPASRRPASRHQNGRQGRPAGAAVICPGAPRVPSGSAPGKRPVAYRGFSVPAYQLMAVFASLKARARGVERDVLAALEPSGHCNGRRRARFGCERSNDGSPT
jgi:hypothetical protein